MFKEILKHIKHQKCTIQTFNSLNYVLDKNIIDNTHTIYHAMWGMKLSNCRVQATKTGGSAQEFAWPTFIRNLSPNGNLHRSIWERIPRKWTSLDAWVQWIKRDASIIMTPWGFLDNMHSGPTVCSALAANSSLFRHTFLGVRYVRSIWARTLNFQATIKSFVLYKCIISTFVASLPRCLITYYDVFALRTQAGISQQSCLCG